MLTFLSQFFILSTVRKSWQSKFSRSLVTLVTDL